MKQPAVYILASGRNGTLYTGVTSALVKRIYEHKTKVARGFSQKYNCNRLVWYELHEEMIPAIAKEKQLKAGSRKQKLALIEAMNPDWEDLYLQIIGGPQLGILYSLTHGKTYRSSLRAVADGVAIHKNVTKW